MGGGVGRKAAGRVSAGRGRGYIVFLEPKLPPSMKGEGRNVGLGCEFQFEPQSPNSNHD